MTPEQLEFTPRELELATKWRTHRFGELCIEELLREYRQDFERQIACGRDRVRVLSDRLTARDEHCDKLEASIATLTAERDALCARVAELEAELLDIRDAISPESSSPEHSAEIARATRIERDMLRTRIAELEAPEHVLATAEQLLWESVGECDVHLRDSSAFIGCWPSGPHDVADSLSNAFAALKGGGK